MSLADNSQTDWFTPGDFGFSMITKDDIAHEILPRLFLGEVAAARSEIWKQENKIQHVLSCLRVSDEPETKCDKRLSLLDDPSQQIDIYFKQTNKWIQEKLDRNATTGILVHCYAGISRSSTIVIAYLIQVHDYSFWSALPFVKKKRDCASPNAGFERQLLSFAKKLAVDRSLCTIPKDKQRALLPGLNNRKVYLRMRKMFALIWDYSQLERLSDLELVVHFLFAGKVHHQA
jgi:atypical dual specificity phosphatase